MGATSIKGQKPSEPTSVEPSEGEAVPSGHALSQNVPNPFNPVTVIAYDLPKAGDVTLRIYNITGQQIATLVSKHQTAGHYQVAWDGAGFANGIYVYRLQAGQFEEARRMLLLIFRRASTLSTHPMMIPCPTWR